MHSIGVIGLIALLLAWGIHQFIITHKSSAKDHVFHTQKGKVAQIKEQKTCEMVGLTNGRYAAKAAFRAVILGAPGSGKGTISARIVKQFGVTHISSGDKLRAHIANETALGKEVKKYLDSGSLVPDETMITLISEEIKSLGDRNWLLDGFPRTVSQAEELQKIHPVSLVINVNVPDTVILERLKNRWQHLPSGRVYNIGFNDPKIPGKDDVTGEPLMQRPDDQPNIVQARLQQYSTKTKPVIDYYKKLHLLKSFSGFPRTVPQAEMLDEKHSILLAINLIVPDFDILERVKNRWTHLRSGRVYNIGFNDPKVPGRDDVTGEPLSKRPDDHPEIVKRRLDEYMINSKSVIAYYEKRGLLRQFIGTKTNELWLQIQECLKHYL